MEYLSKAKMEPMGKLSWVSADERHNIFTSGSESKNLGRLHRRPGTEK